MRYNNSVVSNICYMGGEIINGFEICRRRAGLTQVQAAAAIGVAQGTISMWETGQTHPTGEKLPKVAEVYNSTIDELFEEEETA